MQALMIPFALTLGLTSAVQLSLLPYAYLADPLPVYHQSQDTRTGQHAYSYSGGPSAKEEVRGLDGITRGSYSYVDANGHLQSVFYVADDHGFRVAATNLPTDEDLPVDPAVELAKRIHFEELSKAGPLNRRRRSLEYSDSAELKHREGQKNVQERRMVELSEIRDNAEHLKPNSNEAGHVETVQTTVYAPLGSVLIPSLAATATSHQRRVQVHNSQGEIKAEPSDSALLIETQPSSVVVENQPSSVVVENQPSSSTLLLSSQVPLATSHQSRIQVHREVRVEPLESESISKAWDESAAVLEVAAEPEIHLPVVPTIKEAGYRVETSPVLSEIHSYLQDRVELHRNLGLEGPGRKDAIKIKTAPVAVVQTPLPAVPAVAEEAFPVVQPITSIPSVATAISSQSRSQIHANSKVEISSATAIKSAVQLETNPIPSVPVLHTLPTVVQSLPLATSSQSRSQLHSGHKLETISPIYVL